MYIGKARNKIQAARHKEKEGIQDLLKIKQLHKVKLFLLDLYPDIFFNLKNYDSDYTTNKASP